VVLDKTPSVIDPNVFNFEKGEKMKHPNTNAPLLCAVVDGHFVLFCHFLASN